MTQPMNGKIKTFSDRYLKSLKSIKSPYDIREGTGGGFAVRVMPSGTISFQFLYRFDSKARRLNLGRYPAMSLADVYYGRGQAVLERREKIKLKTLAMRRQMHYDRQANQQLT